MKLTMKNLKWGAVAIFAAGLGGTANAGPMTWVDTVNLTPAPFLEPLEYVSYTHTLENYNTATDSVDSYTLALNLYDDRDRSSEVALLSQSLDVFNSFFFDLSGTEWATGSVWGVLQLEASGTLTVAITSLVGDFYVGGSTLTVRGKRNSVPEPGTLALFGASILGFGLARRKRQAA